MNPQLQPATTYGAVMGSVLAIRRKNLHMEQTQLAEQLGMTQASWSRIESGITPITLDTLSQASAVLRVAPTQILQQADQAVARLSKQGVRVEYGSTKELLKVGVPLIAAIALIALVVAALNAK